MVECRWRSTKVRLQARAASSSPRPCSSRSGESGKMTPPLSYAVALTVPAGMAASRGASIVGNRFMSPRAADTVAIHSIATLRRRHCWCSMPVASPANPEDPCSTNVRRAAASTFAGRQCVPPKPPRRRGFVRPIAAVIAARVSGSSVDAPVTERARRSPPRIGARSCACRECCGHDQTRRAL